MSALITSSRHAQLQARRFQIESGSTRESFTPQFLVRQSTSAAGTCILH